MKTLKKIIAVMLAVITVFSLGAFSASAASAPEFELRLVSQNGTKATFELWLVNGQCNCFDIYFKNSKAVKAFDYMVTTDDFDAYIKALQKSENAQMTESSSAANKRISLACTAAISKNISIYEIEVTTASSAPLKATDITAYFDECILDNKSIVSSVKCTTVLSSIDIEQDGLELNYKQSASLTVASDIDAEDITWTTSNAKVATVDANGNVYAAGTGTAVITASDEDGEITDTCTVTVKYAWWQWIIVIVLFGWLWY